MLRLASRAESLGSTPRLGKLALFILEWSVLR